MSQVEQEFNSEKNVAVFVQHSFTNGIDSFLRVVSNLSRGRTRLEKRTDKKINDTDIIYHSLFTFYFLIIFYFLFHLIM